MSRRTKLVLHRYYCHTRGTKIIIVAFLTRSIPCPIHYLPNMNVMRNEVRFACPCSTTHAYAPGFNIALWISKWSEVWAVGLCLYGNHDQWYRFSMQSGDNFCRRTETRLSVRQTRSKIQSCLLKCFQDSLIFQIIEKKLVPRQTRERLGGEKRGCGSNDEGNHFIPILPAHIFLTREITGLQTFLSEDDEEILTSEILNSLAHEERQATWKSIGMSKYAGWTE